MALLETLSAKMRIFRVPEFLGTAFLLAVIGLAGQRLAGGRMMQHLPQLINLFATLILMLSFAMISQRRIVSLINLFAMQGAALVVASVLLGYATHQPDLYVSAGLTLVLKVVLIPWMLHRMIRALNVRWDVETLHQRPDHHAGGHWAGDFFIQSGACRSRACRTRWPAVRSALRWPACCCRS